MQNEIVSYKDLKVWQHSIVLANTIYRVTRPFPKEEVYGITSQMRRAGISVASNIAEGSVRGTKEFIHFLSIARGSLAELETQAVIAKNELYLSDADYATLTKLSDTLSRMLMRLMQSLKNTQHKAPVTQLTNVS